MNDDHVKNQLCARIEELEKEKLELNERLDVAQRERDELSEQLKTSRRDYEVMNKFREGAEAERDSLAAHVARWKEWLGRDPEDDAGDWMDEGWAIAKESPTTSLARRDLLKQAEVLEEAGRYIRCEEDAALLRINAQELRRQAEEDA